MKIGIIVGSLRKDSYSMKIAKTIKQMIDYETEIIDINLEMYNEDLEKNTPGNWINFRNKAKEMNAFIFVTPEYNRSVPAVIKNALDVGSRPYGKSVWNEKPGAIVSVSPGKMGAFGANHHLRQSMVFLNVYMLQQPEIYLGNVDSSFDEEGDILPKTKEYLNNFVTEYIKWVNKFVN